MLERGTANFAFLVPKTVLSDHCVAASHRAEHSYVQIRCRDEPAGLIKDEGGFERYDLPNGRVPIGRGDARARPPVSMGLAG